MPTASIPRRTPLPPRAPDGARKMAMSDPVTATLEVTVNEVQADLLPQPETSFDRRRGLTHLMGGLSLGSGLAILLGRADAQGMKKVRGDKKKKAKAGPAGPA